MRKSLAASTALHLGVLVLTLVSFAGAKTFEPMTQDIPVDVITSAEFTKLTKGALTGQKTEKPKQVAEKVAAPTPIEDPKLKASEKPPVEATTPPPPPPPPPPQKAEQPTQAKAEPAPPPKETAEVALKNEPKKQEQPQEQAKAEAAPPLPPRKPAPPREQPKPIEANATPREFNTDQIKQLIDKRTPSRQVASADQVSTTSSIGAPSGQAVALSVSEIDAFKRRLRDCWTEIPGNLNAPTLVDVDIYFNQDGTLSAQPRVVPGQSGSANPTFQAVASIGVRAIMQCQPYKMFRQEKYAEWKTLGITLSDKMFSQ
ncbi:hypothetical protein ABLE93_10630 [Xanthobacter sp. KR7-65]|uniref:hypothetical protein n=1 Tax=Xanthobacter sp. KR7-65 TaxID=3156612 RepID=UPI0032B41FFF